MNATMGDYNDEEISRHAFPASPTLTPVGESTGIPSRQVYYLIPLTRENRNGS